VIAMMRPLSGHQLLRLLDANEERFGLRVHRRVPLVETDRQRRLVERAHLRTRIGHEDVEASELAPHAADQALDLRRLADVGLDGESVGAARSDLLERGLRRGLVFQVIDRDVDAMIRELQRDAAADAA
jgi:hypothetical protein